MKTINLQDYKKNKFKQDYIKQCIAYYGYSKEQQQLDKHVHSK